MVATRATRIQGTGSYLPGAPIPNAALVAVLGRRVKHLCEAIGVQQRYLALDPLNGWRPSGVRNSTMAAQAATRALADADRAVGDVDLLILVTATPDYPFPATVTLVQEQLGIKECVALELRAACAGVPQAFAIADSFLCSGRATTALLIASELSSCFVDLQATRERLQAWPDDMLVSAVMFGDGAGAAVLTACEAEGPRDGVFATVLNSVGAGRPPGFVCLVGGSLAPFRTDNAALSTPLLHDFRAILEMGPTMVLRAFADLSAITGLGADDFRLIVPPQANPGLITKTLELQGLSTDRVFFNVQRVGNTSSASLLIALDELSRTRLVSAGDRVALLGAEASKWLYGAVALTWTRQEHDASNGGTPEFP